MGALCEASSGTEAWALSGAQPKAREREPWLRPDRLAASAAWISASTNWSSASARFLFFSSLFRCNSAEEELPLPALRLDRKERSSSQMAARALSSDQVTGTAGAAENVDRWFSLSTSLRTLFGGSWEPLLLWIVFEALESPGEKPVLFWSILPTYVLGRDQYG